MNFEIINEKENKMTFVIDGVTGAFLNSIRRVSTSEVPVMAIEEVEFTNNSSVLYDEIIAHRLGLIPLKTDLKTYKLPSECKCGGEGCNACTAHFSLSVKGPGTVMAKDLKPKDPKIKPVFEEMPVTKLTENQELKFNASAVLGIGKDHSKFIPCLFIFNKYPELKSTGKVSEKCVETCPKGILEVKDGKISITDPTKCDLCKSCAEECKNIEFLSSDDKFVGTIESWGQLEPKEILLESVNVLNKKLKEFVKAFK